MADFSITRPESITPANDAGGKDSPRGDARQQRRQRPNPEPPPADVPDAPHDDDTTHQIDELA